MEDAILQNCCLLESGTQRNGTYVDAKKWPTCLSVVTRISAVRWNGYWKGGKAKIQVMQLMEMAGANQICSAQKGSHTQTSSQLAIICLRSSLSIENLEHPSKFQETAGVKGIYSKYTSNVSNFGCRLATGGAVWSCGVGRGQATGLLDGSSSQHSGVCSMGWYQSYCLSQRGEQ